MSLQPSCAFAFTIFTLIGVAHGGELLGPERPIAEVVDHYINSQLAEESVTPAPITDDANLARRTTLDLIGRIPTLDEVKTYLDSSEENKREQLVDRFIGSPAFIRHQVNEFDTLLMHGSGKDLKKYLATAFEENRPWDKMFREMLVGDQSDDAVREATQFVRSRAKDIDKLTNEASVIFFGINVSCAKCHDHPLVPQWTQDHFYGMKSFFSRTFENGDFIGERDYGIVKYKTTAGEERTAQLMFLSGTVVDEPESKEPSDKEKKEEKKKLDELKKKKQPPAAPQFSRRSQLVDVALRSNENRFLAKAIVNRVWYRLFGHGLVMPLDQMHPENVPSHPELLDWLARDFVEHQYDLQRLIRGLVLTDAYARSSRWESDAERPRPYLFAVGNVRPLTPNQYAEALRFASSNPDVFASEMKSEDREKQIEGVSNAARGLAGLFEQPGEDFQVSVTEALVFSNSDKIMSDLVRDAGNTLIGRLKSIEDDKEAVETAIWNIYSRPPEAEETAMLMDYLKQRKDQRVGALQQMIWAMLAASESRFNY